MIAVLVIVAAVLSILLALALYLVGFHLGEEEGKSELVRVRMEAAQAERRMHDLTRQTFVAMAERAEERRLQS